MMNKWQCGDFSFSLDRPLVMGIVNITPDSFSDGGQFVNAKDAVTHGLKLLEEGADILDIGGESTRPGAESVSVEDEKARVLPVIEKLAAHGAAVSADTMKPEVMKSALSAGACILNDVCGFCAPETEAVVAGSACGAVAMHMKGTPRTMQTAPHYDNVCEEVGEFLQQRARALVAAGVSSSRICLDPGIGFGKTTAHNLELLRNLSELGGEYPVLVGVSRKALLGELSGEQSPQARDVASAVAAAILSQHGAAVLRVHNVAATKQALAGAAALLESDMESD